MRRVRAMAGNPGFIEPKGVGRMAEPNPDEFPDAPEDELPDANPPAVPGSDAEHPNTDPQWIVPATRD
jgi:hypothetical protein